MSLKVMTSYLYVPLCKLAKVFIRLSINVFLALDTSHLFIHGKSSVDGYEWNVIFSFAVQFNI